MAEFTQLVLAKKVARQEQKLMLFAVEMRLDQSRQVPEHLGPVLAPLFSETGKLAEVPFDLLVLSFQFCDEVLGPLVILKRIVEALLPGASGVRCRAH